MTILSAQYLTLGLLEISLALVILDSFLVSEHESKGGYCTRQGPEPIISRNLGFWCYMGQGLRPVGPWALALYYHL